MTFLFHIIALWWSQDATHSSTGVRTQKTDWSQCWDETHSAPHPGSQSAATREKTGIRTAFIKYLNPKAQCTTNLNITCLAINVCHSELVMAGLRFFSDFLLFLRTPAPPGVSWQSEVVWKACPKWNLLMMLERACNHHYLGNFHVLWVCSLAVFIKGSQFEFTEKI